MLKYWQLVRNNLGNMFSKGHRDLFLFPIATHFIFKTWTEYVCFVQEGKLLGIIFYERAFYLLYATLPWVRNFISDH